MPFIPPDGAGMTEDTVSHGMVEIAHVCPNDFIATTLRGEATTVCDRLWHVCMLMEVNTRREDTWLP